MWLTDLEMAIGDLRGCVNDVCIDKITPSVGGIVFHTTDHNAYRWNKETRGISLYKDGDWRKAPWRQLII